MGKRLWGGVVCDTPKSREAVLSWFRPLVPDAWGLPIYAQLQEDVDTGRETAMRALFLLPDGALKEAYRALSRNSWRLKVSNASPGLLKAPYVRETIARAKDAALARMSGGE